MMLLFSSVTQAFALPPGLLASICFVESGYRASVIHKDDGGQDSLGLCQVQYTTAKAVGFKGKPKQLLNPATNAYYAGKFLASQIKRYHDVDRGIVAYNLGHYSPTYTKYLKKVRKAWKTHPHDN